ncbi:hypothetical protein GCM10010169_59370 [Micromonospora fulviviridis]|uniref:hypothetical protein n=1 Tax=Micromonospora fulviviridis TaxID=47860 RepID=UPI001665F3C5|nr:hypothetical protein [Micromonospora fulviviridis]GGS06745.1 hypothetical protein GCM10010169_59370 [Micromonospora fulviviridis]
MIAFAAVAAVPVSVVVAVAAVTADLVGAVSVVVAVAAVAAALVGRPRLVRSWRVSVPVERQLAKIAGPRVVG